MLQDYAVELGTFTYACALPPQAPPSLDQIKAAQDVMLAGIAAGELQEAECPVRHYFSPGQYTRECTIPAGATVVGKMHRHQHPVFLMQGSVAINTDRGMELIHAPHIWISQPDAKRILRCVTECVFATVHLNPTDTQDLAAIEADVIVPEALIEYSPNEKLGQFTDELQGVYA